jgi:hypothetical protein
MRDSYGDDATAPAAPNGGYGPGALAQKPTARQPPGDQALNAPARSNAGRPDRNVAGPAGRQPRGSRQFARSWDELAGVLEFATVPVRGYQRTVPTPQGPRAEVVRPHIENTAGAQQMRQLAAQVSTVHGPVAAAHIRTAATAIQAGDYDTAGSALQRAHATIADDISRGFGARDTLNRLTSLARSWIPKAK